MSGLALLRPKVYWEKCSTKSINSLSVSLFLLLHWASPNIPYRYSWLACSMPRKAYSIAWPTLVVVSRTSFQWQPAGISKRCISGIEAYSASPSDSSNAVWYSSSYTSEIRLKNNRGKMYTLKSEASTGPLRIQAALDRYCSNCESVSFSTDMVYCLNLILK